MSRLCHRAIWPACDPRTLQSCWSFPEISEQTNSSPVSSAANFMAQGNITTRGTTKASEIKLHWVCVYTQTPPHTHISSRPVVCFLMWMSVCYVMTQVWTWPVNTHRFSLGELFFSQMVISFKKQNRSILFYWVLVCAYHQHQINIGILLTRRRRDVPTIP